MTERPILFSGSMVRAILEGRKTQTRRVIKPLPEQFTPRGLAFLKCLYGVPGDWLWVRETWAVDAPLDEVRREREDVMRVEPIFGHGPYYRADGIHDNTGLTWRPAIHMPRWACRLVLEVAAVRVERLQDISEADALAEGVQCYHNVGESEFDRCDVSAAGHFAELWDSINAKRAPWASNPWVWVIEFRRAT